VDLTLDIDGGQVVGSIPRFNRPGFTLTGVTIRGFYRANVTLGIENQNAMGGTGRWSLRPGANLELALPGGNTYYLAFIGGTSKGRELSLSGFDGTRDYMGTSGRTENLSFSQGTAVRLADPFLLASLSGPGSVDLIGSAGAQVGWDWYRGLRMGWPELVASGGGPARFVVIYEFVPTP
jgi:hypothetical protein